MAAKRPAGDGGDPDDEEPSFDRGFNNPNIMFSVQFKNKIKNNNYEFIVTIQSESHESPGKKTVSSIFKKNESFFKQYKVKRNLYEFQELFTYLENKTPTDELLRNCDYNQMFKPVNEGENLYMLEDFINGLVKNVTYLLD